MTADFAVQNSLYIISKLQLHCDGVSRRMGRAQPPSIRGTLPITLACIKKRKNEVNPRYMQFFIPMQPPTTTHNAKQLHAYMKGGQPHAVLHDSPELKAARAKLHAYLAPHAPKAPIPAGQPVRLLVKWCFPTEGKRRSGEWRTSKPDTDNLEKALKDEMTRLHFWDDDAQVCSEIVEKFWSDPCGVFVRVEELA